MIALSQLSRGGEGMAALRGSGQIEQDADVVMLLDVPSERTARRATRRPLIWKQAACA